MLSMLATARVWTLSLAKHPGYCKSMYSVPFPLLHKLVLHCCQACEAAYAWIVCVAIEMSTYYYY